MRGYAMYHEEKKNINMFARQLLLQKQKNGKPS